MHDATEVADEPSFAFDNGSAVSAGVPGALAVRPNDSLTFAAVEPFQLALPVNAHVAVHAPLAASALLRATVVWERSH